MPGSAFGSFYCEHVTNGVLPYVLLVMPLAGAYLYGQRKKQIAWILILVWAGIQLATQGLSLFIFNCNADM